MEKAGIKKMLEQNLGDFAQEISLEKLEEIDEESINMTVLKDQKWDRGQVNYIFKKKKILVTIQYKIIKRLQS